MKSSNLLKYTKIAFRKNESPHLWAISLVDNSIVRSTKRQKEFKSESDQQSTFAGWQNHKDFQKETQSLTKSFQST